MRGAESESRNVTDLEQCCSHGTGWSSLRILVQKNGSGDDRHVPLCMPLWATVYPQHTVCQVHLRGPGKSATLQVTGVEALEIFPGTLRVSSLLRFRRQRTLAIHDIINTCQSSLFPIACAGSSGLSTLPPRLPTAYTCFSLLLLPLYSSVEAKRAVHCFQARASARPARC